MPRTEKNPTSSPAKTIDAGLSMDTPKQSGASVPAAPSSSMLAGDRAKVGPGERDRAMKTTCDDCGCAGYRADNPDGTRQDGSHVPDGETVLVDSPEDAGAMLCQDCYDQRRERVLYVVNGDAESLEGWTVATLAAALRPVLAPLGVDVVERPNESGLGGLQGGDDALREEIRRIEERVIQQGA